MIERNIYDVTAAQIEFTVGPNPLKMSHTKTILKNLIKIWHLKVGS